MKTHTLLKALLYAAYSFLIFPLGMRGQNWSDLQISFVSEDTLRTPWHGKKPMGKIRIINTGAGDFCNISYSNTITNDVDNQEIDAVPFPNGGKIKIGPYDTTWAQCWLEHPQSFTTIGTHTWTLNFVFQAGWLGTQTFSQNMVTVVDNLNNQPQGPVTISGSVYYPLGGNPSQINVGLASQNYLCPSIPFNSQMSGGSFSASIPGFVSGLQWYIKISAPGYETKFIELNQTNLTTLAETLQVKTYASSPVFTLLDTVHTHVGFWKGAVSEPEQTVVFFPGQENWLGGNISNCADSIQKTKSRIFKYTFGGTKLWEYAPGWECWAGDMSDDGSKVAFSIEHSTYGTSCDAPISEVSLLDGLTGALVWRDTTVPYTESKEVKFSHNGQYLIVGSGGNGHISCYDVASGQRLYSVLDNCDNPTAIRKIVFENTDTYFYTSSGDSHVRKFRLSDGAIMWKTYVGSWGWVRGFELSADQSLLLNGGKSGDITVLDAVTGEVKWTHNQANYNDAVFSPDGAKVATFTGQIYDVTSGDLIGFMPSLAPPAFYDNERILKLPAEIRMYDEGGSELYNSVTALQCGLAAGPGEQVQWVYYSQSTGYAILAGRDMDTPQEPGIAFYQTDLSTSSHAQLAERSVYAEVFPNPVAGGGEVFIKVSAGAFTDGGEIELIDMQGRSLLKKELTRGAVDLQTIFIPDVLAGVYLLKLNLSGQSVFKKLVLAGQK